MAKYDFSKMREQMKKSVENRERAGGGTKYNLPEGVEFIQVKKGTRFFDMIPYVITKPGHPEGFRPGQVWFRREVLVHYGVGPEDKSYLCPLTVGKPCPICTHRQTLVKAKNEDTELIQQLKPKSRLLYNVIDLEGEDSKIRLLEISRFLFDNKLEEEWNNADEEFQSFMSPIEGATLKVRFGEKKLGQFTFFEAQRIDFVKRERQYRETIVEKAYDLDAIMNILPYEKLEQIFLGITADVDADEEAPVAPRKRNVEPEPEEEAPVAPRKRNVEPEEEVDETPAPPVRRHAKSEEEETPAPPVRRKRQPEPEEEPEDDRPAPSKKETVKGHCPHGHKYGYECEEHPDCDTCDEWDGCSVTRDDLRASGELRKKSK